MESILNKKRKFENPELEVILFSTDDIIVTSAGDFGDGQGQEGDDFANS